MRVTSGQRDEWGGDLAKSADILDVDEMGIQVLIAERGDLVKLTVDSTTTTGAKRAYLTPDDADALADLLKQRAAEVRARQ